jgi:hypothetical protein
MTMEDRITALEQRVAELEAKLLEQRVDRVTEHPESTVKWRDVRRTYPTVQVGDVIQFPSGVTHRITNWGELRFAQWLIEHDKAVVIETSESGGGHR